MLELQTVSPKMILIISPKGLIGNVQSQALGVQFVHSANVRRRRIFCKMAKRSGNFLVSASESLGAPCATGGLPTQQTMPNLVNLFGKPQENMRQLLVTKRNETTPRDSAI